MSTNILLPLLCIFSTFYMARLYIKKIKDIFMPEFEGLPNEQLF
jgi:hypothetical protein